MANESINKNRKNSYVKMHAARNEKQLAGKLEWLSSNYVRVISEHCQQWLDNPNAAVAMISLLTGWSVTDLLKSETKLVCDSSGAFHLLSPWSFNDPKITSPLRAHLHKPEDKAAIPLPKELGKLLQDIKSHHNLRGVTKKSVGKLLAEIPTEEDLRITPVRVSNTLHYYGSSAGLSKFECRFISGQRMHETSQNYYVCFDVGTTYDKLYKFWDWVLAKTSWHYPTPPVQNFGSKRALNKLGIQSIFAWYKSNILEKTIFNDSRAIFNLFTLYVIDLLQLVTLCRPVDAIFGSLDNFDHSFEFIFIRDKGDDSPRLLPLPKIIRPTLQGYIRYLKEIQSQSTFTNKYIFEIVQKILAGKAPFFHFWEKDEMLPVTVSKIKTRLSHFDIHRNWHRHTVITALYEKGLCTDKLACFADHQPSLDHWFNQYSSLDYTPIVEISRQIELLLEHWEVPIIVPPFGRGSLR